MSKTEVFELDVYSSFLIKAIAKVVAKGPDTLTNQMVWNIVIHQYICCQSINILYTTERAGPEIDSNLSMVGWRPCWIWESIFHNQMIRDVLAYLIHKISSSNLIMHVQCIHYLIILLLREQIHVFVCY